MPKRSMHVSKTAGSEKRLDKPDADVNRQITTGKSASILDCGIVPGWRISSGSRGYAAT
ncbi:MAG TPA: hypothetical protein VGV35_03860 [Bryobacteraceae bacterium]|nr:hypothetical protein [Bryobacteraceae bacterium]